MHAVMIDDDALPSVALQAAHVYASHAPSLAAGSPRAADAARCFA
jgi:hypothetical protein